MLTQQVLTGLVDDDQDSDQAGDGDSGHHHRRIEQQMHTVADHYR